MTDRQAEAAYAAERFLHPGGLFLTTDDVQARADQITTSIEWQQIAPWVPERVHVVRRRFPSGYYAARANRRTDVVSLADWCTCWDERLLLHELAHLAAPASGHGPGWRTVYLYLLETFTHDPRAAAVGYEPGREQADRLRVGLARGGLRLIDRRPVPLPADLSHLTDPDLSDDDIETGITNAFWARMRAREHTHPAPV